MKEWQRVVVFMTALSLSLAGCGGGGNSAVGTGPTGGENPAPVTTVTGQVADGYLRGATVCLDVDGNKACDDDEPKATTAERGVYTIDATELAKLPEGKLASDFPIFVVVPASAVDEDKLERGDADPSVGKAYVLSAPPGKPEFVSPITTLVHQQLEKNPALTTEEAEKTVKDQIGVSEGVSLFKDYVKEKANNDDLQVKNEFARVHMVAQVVARTMGDLQAEVREAAAGANINVEENLDAIVKLVVEEVLNRLDAIRDAVVQAETSGTAFNPDDVANGVNTAAEAEAEAEGTSLTDTIATRIEEQKAVIVKSSFQSMLEGEGTFWLEYWFDGQGGNFEYGNVKLVGGQPADSDYEWDGSSWIPSTSDDGAEWILKDGQWKAYSDKASSYTVVFNADGSASLSHKESGLQEKLTAVEYDLSSKPQAMIYGGRTEFLKDPTKVFPAGAKGYKLNFMPLEEVYSVDSWTNDQGEDQNFVRYWNQASSQEVVITTLDQLKTSYAQASGNYLEIGWGKGFNLAVQFGANEVLHLFERSHDWSQAPRALDKTGSWSHVQVQGVPMIKIAVPDISRATYRMEGIPFFVVKDGKVRRGEYTPANVVETDSEININKTAFDSLKANISFDFTPPVDPGTGGTGTGTGGTGTGTGGTDPGTGTGVQGVIQNGPLYEFEAWYNPPYESFLGFSGIRGDGNGGVIEAESEYDFDAQSWMALTEPDSDWILTGNGWVLADDLPQDYNIVYNNDGTAALTHKVTGVREILAFSEVDLQGSLHQDFLSGGAGLLVEPAATFPAGARGYRSTFRLLDDVYEVEVDITEFGSDNNYVVEKTVDDPNNFTAVISMDTLSNLAVVHGEGSPNYLDLSQVSFNSGSESLHVQFGTDGSVSCFTFKQVYNPNGPAYVWTEVPLDMKGSWQITSAHGKEILLITLPPEYVETYGIEGTPFVAEVEGAFRYGSFFQASSVEHEEGLMINKTAYDSLMGNLSVNPPQTPQP